MSFLPLTVECRRDFEVPSINVMDSGVERTLANLMAQLIEARIPAVGIRHNVKFKSPHYEIHECTYGWGDTDNQCPGAITSVPWLFMVAARGERTKAGKISSLHSRWYFL